MRTKIYIKELESEVLRLRKSEAAAKAKADMLEHKTHDLLQHLLAHGIQPPDDISVSDGTPTPSLGTQHTNGRAGFTQTLPEHVRHASPPSTVQGWSPPPAYPDMQQEPVSMLPNGHLAVANSAFWPADQLPNATQQPEPTAAFAFDDSQAELDFVLTYGTCDLLIS